MANDSLFIPDDDDDPVESWRKPIGPFQEDEEDISSNDNTDNKDKIIAGRAPPAAKSRIKHTATFPGIQGHSRLHQSGCRRQLGVDDHMDRPNASLRGPLGRRDIAPPPWSAPKHVRAGSECLDTDEEQIRKANDFLNAQFEERRKGRVRGSSTTYTAMQKYNAFSPTISKQSVLGEVSALKKSPEQEGPGPKRAKKAAAKDTGLSSCKHFGAEHLVQSADDPVDILELLEYFEQYEAENPGATQSAPLEISSSSDGEEQDDDEVEGD